MPQAPFAVTPDDVTVDADGRVIVNNPELAARIKPPPPLYRPYQQTGTATGVLPIPSPTAGSVCRAQGDRADPGALTSDYANDNLGGSLIPKG